MFLMASQMAKAFWTSTMDKGTRVGSLMANFKDRAFLKRHFALLKANGLKINFTVGVR